MFASGGNLNGQKAERRMGGKEKNGFPLEIGTLLENGPETICVSLISMLCLHPETLSMASLRSKDSFL